MIRLKEYCFENVIDIYEAAFNNNDYTKHDYVYVIGVLNDIKDNKLLKFGNKNSGPFTYCKLSITNEQTDIIDNSLKDNNAFISNFGDVNKFNLFFKNVNYTLYNDPEAKTKIKSDVINGLWKHIFKGDYSGKNSVGASYGQIFESLVCFLYNYDIKGNYSNDLIDTWTKRFNVDVHNAEYPSWIESSKLSADILKDTFGTNYIAYHVDANDLFNNQADAKYLDISKIFAGKSGIKEVFPQNKDFMNIYVGDKKDKWNAADIVLVSKNLDLKETIEYFGTAADGEALNIKLVEYTVNEKILPISLKKIRKNGHIYAHNIKSNRKFINDSDYNITNVTITFGKTYQNDGLTGNFVINGQNAEIQIRKQASNTNISIEAKLSNNKYARAGKGITVVKQKLNLIKVPNDEYYHTFKDNDDLWNFFVTNEFNTDLNKKQFDALAQKYPDLKDRICFRGFAGLYHVWNKQNSNVTSKPVEFSKFLWECCTECPGSYWIIK